ncbi:MAG: hypothetical protein ABI655_13925 [Phenylobacterium sp.]
MADSTWWRCWTLGQGEITSSAIALVRAHPGFHEAMRYSLQGSLRFSDGEPMLCSLMVDNGGFLMAGTALYLDADGGLTHRRLQEVAGIPGILSAGRISALLLRMQMIDFVQAPSQHMPGTPKIYRPTARLTAAFRKRARLELEAVQLMSPEMDELLARFDEPDGLRRLMRLAGHMIHVTSHPRPELASILAIGSRRAGILLLYALLDATADAAGHFPATGPVRVSISALAKRFRLSRTHIRRVLREAEATGLFTSGAAEGEGEVQPALLEAIEIMYAGVFVGVANAAYLALGDQADAEVAA